MTDSQLFPQLHSSRREFLCRTAAVLGGAALGVGGAAQAKPAAPGPPLSLAYWTGTTLVDARHLPAGDPALRVIRITVQGHHRGQDLRAINAYFDIPGHDSPVLFRAWTAAPSSPACRFTVPVISGCVLLSAVGAGEYFCRLRTDAASDQPKLRPGVYVLALGEPHWQACCFDPAGLTHFAGPLTERTFSGFVPARFGYRVLTVEAA